MPRTTLFRVATVFCAFLFVLTGVGCRSAEVDWAVNDAIDLSAGTQYAWVEGEQKGMGLLPMAGEPLDTAIVSAVDDALADLGYQKIDDPDEAHFIMTYVAIRSLTTVTGNPMPQLDPRFDRLTDPNPVPQPEMTPIGAQGERYGLLILDAMDPETYVTGWRGVARGLIDRDASLDQKQASVSAIARRLMSKFPALRPE